MYDSMRCSRPLVSGSVLLQRMMGLEGAMDKAAKKSRPGISSASQISESVAWLGCSRTRPG